MDKSKKFKRWLIKKIGYDISFFEDKIEDLGISNREMAIRMKELSKDVSKYRSNRLLRLIENVSILNKIKDPRESMDSVSRRDYCARIAGLKRELNSLIDFMIADQIEQLARTMFDPNKFSSLDHQHMFNAGNINFGDLLKEQFDDIFQEHLGNVENAKQGIPPSVEDSPVQSMDREAKDFSENSEEDFDLLGIINSIDTKAK